MFPLPIQHDLGRSRTTLTGADAVAIVSEVTAFPVGRCEDWAVLVAVMPFTATRTLRWVVKATSPARPPLVGPNPGQHLGDRQVAYRRLHTPDRPGR